MAKKSAMPEVQTELALPEPEGRVTTKDIIALLAARYSSPEYTFLREVRNTTGWAHEIRSADALAYGSWPSSGLELHGFEVKASRGDWLRELKDPAKAQTISKFCDRWWLVVASPRIVRDVELPSGWGLLVVVGDPEARLSLRAVVEAPKRETEPLSRAFLASLLRNALASTLLDEEKSRIEANANLRVREAANKAAQGALEQIDAAKSQVKRFEEKTGIDVLGFDGERFGAAIRFLLDERGWNSANAPRMRERLLEMATTLESEAARLRTVAGQFNVFDKLVSELRGKVPT